VNEVVQYRSCRQFASHLSYAIGTAGYSVQTAGSLCLRNSAVHQLYDAGVRPPACCDVSFSTRWYRCTWTRRGFVAIVVAEKLKQWRCVECSAMPAWMKCRPLFTTHVGRQTMEICILILCNYKKNYRYTNGMRSKSRNMLIWFTANIQRARRALSVAAPFTCNSTCWDSTVRKHSHFQTPFVNPSIQTHLVLLCCIKRFCISMKGSTNVISICYWP